MAFLILSQSGNQENKLKLIQTNNWYTISWSHLNPQDVWRYINSRSLQLVQYM